MLAPLQKRAPKFHRDFLIFFLLSKMAHYRGANLLYIRLLFA